MRETQAAYAAYLGASYTAFEAGGDWIPAAVSALDGYLRVAKHLEATDRLFNWRSDFAGSVIPEFIIRFCDALLRRQALEPIFTTRESVVELTLSGAGAGWTVRRKNQDVCLGLEEIVLAGDEAATRFLVPLIVGEVKTNLDINKLSGLDFSAEALKRSFPLARYFIVTETVDFSLEQNYVAGSVDEIFVLRMAVRSQHRRIAVALQPEPFRALFAEILRILEAAGATHGHVYTRLSNGKLIDDPAHRAAIPGTRLEASGEGPD